MVVVLFLHMASVQWVAYVTWEMGNSFSIEFVGNPNLDFIQHIQNVKFCQSNAVGGVTCRMRSL